jgi:hypothetical protein
MSRIVVECLECRCCPARVSLSLDAEGVLHVIEPRHHQEQVLVDLNQDQSEVLVHVPGERAVYQFDPSLVSAVLFSGDFRLFSDLLPPIPPGGSVADAIVYQVPVPPGFQPLRYIPPTDPVFQPVFQSLGLIDGWVERGVLG